MNDHVARHPGCRHPGLIPVRASPMLCLVNRRSYKKVPAPGHVFMSAAAIGGMSLALVVGLEVIGFLGAVNQWIANSLSRGGLETFPNRLPGWCPWLAVAAFPFCLAFAMLSSPGHPRRAALWLGAMVLLGTWGPVLSLAAYAPSIAGPWIATFWAGFCAMVHSSRLQMPTDTSPPATLR